MGTGQGDREGVYNEAGVDLTLLDELASWTPRERLLHNDVMLNLVLRLEAAVLAGRTDGDPRYSVSCPAPAPAPAPAEKA
jgi:hypothetical protein